VVTGASPLGVETDADISWRKDVLQKIGYKLWWLRSHWAESYPASWSVFLQQPT
jgi:hypothetical protein